MTGPNDSLFDVSSQIVLVSGGSRGIGRALAAGFVERGATVIVTGRDQAKLDECAATLGVEARVCDVREAGAAGNLVADLVSSHGRIDTLLNVAGVNRRMPAESYDPETYDFIVDINLKGAFFMATAVGRQMLAQGGGTQIHIDSLNTYQPLKHVVPYAMSKSGMVAMTRGLAMEWGDRGVRVNSIAPGWISTDLTKELFAREDMHAWFMGHTPLKRMGRVEDIVGGAIYLASAASSWMTGQTLRIDGGASSGFMWPIDA